MITKELEAFVVTAQSGSFQKASELLFISSTALIKQITSLENEIGLKLFYRTNKGVSLTEAGKIFYKASFDILQRYHAAIQSAKEAESMFCSPVRFGFSQINPHLKFTDSFLCELNFSSSITPHLVPIGSEYKDFIDELRNLGTNVDVIPYFCGHDGLEAVCRTFCLALIPLRIAVPAGHPLYNREYLTYDDLNGHELVSINGEANQYYQVFNEDILQKAPKVNLHVANYYDFTLLNYAVSCKQLVLAGAYLKDAHPLLKFLPVKWEHYLPYGLHYAKHPSEPVRKLLQAFQDAGISGDPDDAPVVEL